MTDALLDPVNPDVLLEGIRPRQVVIPIVGGPPDKASTHVGFPVNREERDFKIDIRTISPLDEDYLVRVLCAFSLDLTQYLRRTFRLVRSKHLPVSCGTSVKQRPDNEPLGE